MGAFLSHPVTDIEFGIEKAKDVTAAYSSMQGWRSSQEDAHLIKLNFDNQGSHIFGIFDGHGSSLTSNYVAKNFVSILMSTDAYKEKNFSLALEQTFMRFDELLEDESVTSQLELEQEKNGDSRLEDDGFMGMFKRRFQELIQGKEDDGDDDIEEEESEKDDKIVENNDSQKTEKTENKAIKKSDSKLVKPSKNSNDSEEKGEKDQSKNEDTDSVTDKEGDKIDDEIDSEDDEDYSDEDAVMGEEDQVASTDMEAMMADARYEKKFAQHLKPAKERELPGYGCGTTANVVIISGGKVYVANAGDSRSVMRRKDEVIPLSADHGPEVETEKNRIEKAGGIIIEGRVNAGLNLTRAIGDLFYKRRTDLAKDEQLIISKPDVRIFDLEPTDRFLVLACDGIWNSLSNEETSKYFEMDDLDIEKQFASMFKSILADGSSPDGFGMDNMSAIFVRLNESNSEEELAKFAENQAKEKIEVSRSSKRKLSESEDYPEKTEHDGSRPTKVARE